MKNITSKIIPLLKKGYCTPQIARLSRELKEPATTIHYNVKKLEKGGAVLSYKAVFDHDKIDEGFSAYVLISLSPEEYGDPKRFALELAKNPCIESVDICNGEWELVAKVFVKDKTEFYNLITNYISKKGVGKIISLVSYKQLKTGFVQV